MSIKYILFSGKIGSGKTTAQKLTVAMLEAQGHAVFSVNLADALKEEVALVYGFPPALCYTDEGKRSTIAIQVGEQEKHETTVGKILQEYGTMMRERHGDSFWIDALVEGTEKYFNGISGDKFVVVGDLRFRNEVEFFQKKSATIVRLEGDPGGARARSTRNLTHCSEIDLDEFTEFDVVIDTEKNIPQVVARWALKAAGVALSSKEEEESEIRPRFGIPFIFDHPENFYC